MPVRSIHSPDLWTSVEQLLNAADEHVCVLPMTSLIKPVRVITLVQIDTTATAAMSPCPPGSVNLPPDTPEPKPESKPESKPEPEADSIVPLYRCYHIPRVDHFYTTSLKERDESPAGGWSIQGIACRVLSKQVPGSVPLYRCYHVNAVDHLYTTDEAEWERAIAAGYNREGIACYVYPTQQEGTIPLYRLWKGDGVDHFYTTDLNERQNAMATLGYVDEGIACYVYPA